MQEPIERIYTTHQLAYSTNLARGERRKEKKREEKRRKEKKREEKRRKEKKREEERKKKYHGN